MFCIECGKRLDDDAKFCSNCGKPQKQAGGANAEQENRQTEETKPEESQTKEIVSFSLPDMVDDSIEVRLAVISSNGKYLAARVIDKDDPGGGRKPIIKIIDTQSKKVIHNINIDGEINELLAVSSSGNLIMASDYSVSFLLDVQKNEKIHEIYHRGFGSCLYAFSSDSKKLAVRLDKDDYDLEVLNTQNGNNLISISGEEEGLLLTKEIVYSPNGRCLAVVPTSSSIWVIWDACNGNKLSKLGKEESRSEGGAIAFSHDGKRFVTLQENVINIWDTQKGTMLLQIGGDFAKYRYDGWGNKLGNCDICFSPDDKAIVVGLDNGQIHIYSAETGELLKQFKEGKQGINWLSFTPDGKTLITFADRTVKFWVADN